MKLGVISLGCDKATVDSERLVGELVGHGARVTPEVDRADVVLINTCGFIDAAKRESIEAILDAARLKADGAVRAVVAVGCLVQRYRDELRQEIPEVDLWLGFSDLHRLVPELASRGLLEDPVARHPGVRQYLGSAPHVRYLKISEGCDHTCAFCAIPLMRGRHRSEPLKRLVREAQLLESQGAKEINLVAQDLAHYGRDLGRDGPKLPDLLTALLRETTVPWFRLLYVYSAGLTPRLLDLMATEQRIVPYMDIPIQHASDRMLERMRRPERRATIREKVALLRDAVPEIAVRSTAIVGFPGETEDDFRQLCDFAEAIGFERLGVFTYSPQEGTRAAQYPDDVPGEVKRARQEELTELQRAISADRLARYVGKTTEVLVDQVLDNAEGERWAVRGERGGPGADRSAPEDGPRPLRSPLTAHSSPAPATHVGRVKWQADDVDGVTYLARGGWARPGELVTATLVDNEDYDFRAVSLPPGEANGTSKDERRRAPDEQRSPSLALARPRSPGSLGSRDS